MPLGYDAHCGCIPANRRAPSHSEAGDQRKADWAQASFILLDLSCDMDKLFAAAGTLPHWKPEIELQIEETQAVLRTLPP